MTTLLLALALTAAPATFMRTIAEGADSPIRERLEVVVKTPAEWAALWRRFAPDKTPEPIDFAHQMVAAIFVGPRPYSGYRVEVFSVAREGGDVVVRYRVHAPAKPLDATSSSTAPYQLVEIPIDRRHVKFIQTVDLGKPAR